MSSLIVGCGYIGLAVARRLVQRGITPFATTRNLEKGNLLAREGIRPLICDWIDRKSVAKTFEEVSTPSTAEKTGEQPNAVRQVLISVGYDRTSSRNMQDTFVEGLSNVLEFLPHDARIVYCSTTGVYHQQDGSWVDESSPCQPTREGGVAHLAAEELLRSANRDSVVLRLAGIYGPGRLPNLASLRSGEHIRATRDGWINLIHRDDIVTAILAAWSHPSPERLYVLSDGNPVCRTDYYAEVARLYGTPAPVFLEPASGEQLTRRGGSDKRINPTRAHRDLLQRLEYPSFREGLLSAMKDLNSRESSTNDFR